MLLKEDEMDTKLIIITQKIPVCTKCRENIIGDRYIILNNNEIYHSNCIVGDLTK